MAQAYSMDLRRRVINDCDAGMGTTAVAGKYSVSPAWVRRLKQHRRERGDIRPRRGGGSRGCKIDRAQLAQMVAKHPDATLVELRDRLGVQVTPWAVGKALRELGWTFKKSRCVRLNRTDRTSPNDARRGVSNS